MGERILKQRYAIQKKLGQNAGRRTYLALDLKTQELVVIKLLIFNADFQWDDFKLFEREAETLQSLSHSAIPRYLEHFQNHSSKTKEFALVQSYIEAKSLEEWVESGRAFNEEELRQIACALLEILMYLHRQSPPVIHRDIKPSNILLGDRSGNSIGQIYLVDFGSVQTLAAREGSTITVVGTYGYMPPEQFGGRAVPASDLYSLGATLIYLATGRHPAELPQEDLKIKFQPKIQLSSSFTNWLNWMTEPNLNDRLTSAEDALIALEKRLQREKNQKIVQRPFDSVVKFKKHQNALELTIPPNPIKYLLMIPALLLIIHPGILLFLIGVYFIFEAVASTLPFPVNFSMGILGLVFVNFTITFGAKWLSSSFPKSTQLRIDRQRISLSCNVFGIVRWHQLPSSPSSAICRLNLGSYDGSAERLSIQIWAGTRKYEIPVQHLSVREVDWLLYELSEWLNLPVTK